MDASFRKVAAQEVAAAEPSDLLTQPVPEVTQLAELEPNLSKLASLTDTDIIQPAE